MYTCFVKNGCRLNQAIILYEGSHSCLILCYETFEPLEAVKWLEARAGEGTYQLCTPVLLEVAVG